MSDIAPATSDECTAGSIPITCARRTRKFFDWRTLAAVAVAILMAWTVFIFSHRVLSPQIPEVQVVRAATSKVGDDTQIVERGYIVAHHRINVNSKVTGRVAWIGVEKGDRVRQGDVLVRLEDDEFRAQVQQAAGAVSNAEAYLQQLRSGARPQEIHQAEHSLQQARAGMLASQLTLQRTKDLVSQGVLAKQSLDDAEARFESSQQQVEYLEQSLQLVKIGSRPEEIARAEGSLEQAKGQLALAQSQLDATVIRAPISGTILERTAEKGELVTAQFAGGSEDGPQGSVVALADLHDLRVALDLPQAKLSSLRLKEEVRITVDAFPDRVYKGRVSEVSPEANSQKGTVPVRIQILKPDSLLRPQMNARVRFSTGDSKHAITRVPGVVVPDGAVLNQDNKKVVFVVSSDDVAHLAEVHVLEHRSEGTVISGVNAGENVVVSSTQNL